MNTDINQPESLRTIFFNSFKLFQKTWIHLFPLTVLLGIAILSPHALLYNPEKPILFFGYFFFSVFIFACVLYYTALIHMSHKDARLGQVLLFVTKKLWIIVITVIVTTFLTLLAYGLLIIPGIIVTVWLSMCVPLILIENAGPLNVFRKSYELTTDHWTRTAAVVFLPMALMSLFGFMIWGGAKWHLIDITYYRTITNIFILLVSFFYLPWVAALIILQFEDLKKRQVIEGSA